MSSSKQCNKRQESTKFPPNALSESEISFASLRATIAFLMTAKAMKVPGKDVGQLYIEESLVNLP